LDILSSGLLGDGVGRSVVSLAWAVGSVAWGVDSFLFRLLGRLFIVHLYIFKCWNNMFRERKEFPQPKHVCARV
jgi:hypothetical protein